MPSSSTESTATSARVCLTCVNNFPDRNCQGCILEIIENYDDLHLLLEQYFTPNILEYKLISIPSEKRKSWIINRLREAAIIGDIVDGYIVIFDQLQNKLHSLYREKDEILRRLWQWQNRAGPSNVSSNLPATSNYNPPQLMDVSWYQRGYNRLPSQICFICPDGCKGCMFSENFANRKDYDQLCDFYGGKDNLQQCLNVIPPGKRKNWIGNRLREIREITIDPVDGFIVIFDQLQLTLKTLESEITNLKAEEEREAREGATAGEGQEGEADSDSNSDWIDNVLK